MSDGQVRRDRIERLREAMGDLSDSLVQIEVRPDGLIGCIEVSGDGVTKSVAMLVIPKEEEETDD